ncbi:MAG: tetratricopeptide repeat protein [Acidimicrobiales bacterium]
MTGARVRRESRSEDWRSASSPPPPMDEWVRTDTERSQPSPPGRAARAERPAILPADVATEIRRAADGATARRKETLVERMERAVQAYERGRYTEAARLGNELTREVAGVAAVRRLAGFASYRLGRWRDGARHLRVYTDLTEEPDAVPALMDCQRALGRHRQLTDQWVALRHRSPEPELLAEARIVAAGSLADRGQLADAIDLLVSAGANKSLRNPSDRHVRQWYALGDLYERAGDLPRARDLFARVARVDAEAYDVLERLDALGRPATPRRSPKKPSRGTNPPK